MSDPKPINKNELSTRAYNVLVRTGLFSNSEVLTAQKVVEFFNSKQKAQECGRMTENELSDWATKVLGAKNLSETAFPTSKCEGLTKRECFAGMALQGYLAGRSGICDSAAAARVAFEYAEAMMKGGGK